MLFQPCDWHEHDAYIDGEKQYVVDAYGRTEDGRVGCIRITGFKPFLYVRAGGERIQGCKMTVMEKYDILAGWNQLETVAVWKLEVNTMEAFRKLKGQVEKRVVYEADLPPFLRIFHEHNLGPGSPFKCTATPIEMKEDDERCVDVMFRASHTTLAPADTIIPLVVACYDLEMYSGHGKFPVAKKSWDAVFKTICEDIDEAPDSISLADILCIRLEKEGGLPNRDHIVRFLKTSGVQDALYDKDIDYLVRKWDMPCIGDPIIQIGVSFRNSTDLLAPTLRKVFVLGTVEEDPEFESFRTERDMILSFSEFLKVQNPDIICGYNTFGFDDGYLVDRCDILDITSSVMFGRTPAYQDKHLVSKTFELASGKYDLRYWNATGRLCIDLLLNMRREHSLDSFKLDNVASVFLRGSVQKVEGRKVYTKSTRGLRARNFVKFETVGNTTDPYTDKVVVEEVGPNYFILQDDVLRDAPESLEWTLAKDDVDAHTLFALHRQGPAERARIARYCIQDCDLVLTLMAKLDTLVNARGMAEVCKVPMSFVLLRGQGIKIFSAVVSIASTRNQILRTQPNGNSNVEDWSYEGAIVIEPKINMYLDQPISVLDFNSLYPTNMIAYNISPDTLVSERTFNPDGKLIASWGKTSDEMRALRKAGYVLDDISYDNKKDDVVTGKTICTYAQPGDAAMSRGILPLVLDILLKKRKETRKLAETIADEGQKAVLNGLQLAYKVVANSVYGQTGSRTSPIRRLCVAASTTAAGRTQLLFAKKVVEEEFNGEVIYGDTDSIFIKFLTKDVGDSIVLGTKAAERITELCRKPYVIGYEKTFYPFILFCRKRYVGMMYEEDPNPAKAKRKSMGIVLKRRDNAPIVKEVFGGALDILLLDRDIKKAQAFVTDTLKKVLEHKIPIEKYVVSKSLRDDYKNPGQIAHRVLADRMAERDPGNKPQVGDRIPYIYVDGRSGKQGDRIDHIDYVRHNNLRPDVEFYITNQIQNPVAQLFALCIESMDGYREPRPSYKQVYDTLLEKRNGNTEEATIDLLAKKEKQLDSLIFLSSETMKNVLRKHKRGPMDAFLRR